MVKQSKNIEVINYALKIIITMKSQPSKRWSVKDFVGLTPKTKSERTIQRYLKSLEQLGVVTGDGCNPQGFKFNGI